VNTHKTVLKKSGKNTVLQYFRKPSTSVHTKVFCSLECGNAHRAKPYKYLYMQDGSVPVYSPYEYSCRTQHAWVSVVSGV